MTQIYCFMYKLKLIHSLSTRFDQIARQLTAIFSWQVQDEFLMRELIAVIFEQVCENWVVKTDNIHWYQSLHTHARCHPISPCVGKAGCVKNFIEMN